MDPSILMFLCMCIVISSVNTPKDSRHIRSKTRGKKFYIYKYVYFYINLKKMDGKKAHTHTHKSDLKQTPQ